MNEWVSALIIGALFGWLLNKAGLTHYARIVDVYLLRDFTVLRFMLSALWVGALAIQLGIGLGLTQAAPIPPTHALSNLVGGGIFGVGMASAGYCPGTIVAEVGEGRLDACCAGLAGLVVGALAYGTVQPWLVPRISGIGDIGRATFSSISATSPWLTAFIFVELVLVVLLLLRGRGRVSAMDAC